MWSLKYGITEEEKIKKEILWKKSNVSNEEFIREGKKIKKMMYEPDEQNRERRKQQLKMKHEQEGNVWKKELNFETQKEHPNFKTSIIIKEKNESEDDDKTLEKIRAKMIKIQQHKEVVDLQKELRNYQNILEEKIEERKKISQEKRNNEQKWHDEKEALIDKIQKLKNEKNKQELPDQEIKLDQKTEINQNKNNKRKVKKKKDISFTIQLILYLIFLKAKQQFQIIISGKKIIDEIKQLEIKKRKKKKIKIIQTQTYLNKTNNQQKNKMLEMEQERNIWTDQFRNTRNFIEEKSKPPKQKQTFKSDLIYNRQVGTKIKRIESNGRTHQLAREQDFNAINHQINRLKATIKKQSNEIFQLTVKNELKKQTENPNTTMIIQKKQQQQQQQQQKLEIKLPTDMIGLLERAIIQLEQKQKKEEEEEKKDQTKREEELKKKLENYQREQNQLSTIWEEEKSKSRNFLQKLEEESEKLKKQKQSNEELKSEIETLKKENLKLRKQKDDDMEQIKKNYTLLQSKTQAQDIETQKYQKELILIKEALEKAKEDQQKMNLWQEQRKKELELQIQKLEETIIKKQEEIAREQQMKNQLTQALQNIQGQYNIIQNNQKEIYQKIQNNHEILIKEQEKIFLNLQNNQEREKNKDVLQDTQKIFKNQEQELQKQQEIQSLIQKLIGEHIQINENKETKEIKIEENENKEYNEEYIKQFTLIQQKLDCIWHEMKEQKQKENNMMTDEEERRREDEERKKKEMKKQQDEEKMKETTRRTNLTLRGLQAQLDKIEEDVNKYQKLTIEKQEIIKLIERIALRNIVKQEKLKYIRESFKEPITEETLIDLLIF